MSNLTRTSRVNVTKNEKIKRLVARIALVIASKENAALYGRYDNVRKKYLALKLNIIKKYTPKAIMVTRQIVKDSKVIKRKK